MTAGVSLPALQAVFNWVWQNSLAASVLVVLVLLVQLAFRPAVSPRWSYALWGLVVFRLLLPLAPASRLSAFNLIALDDARPAVETPTLTHGEAPPILPANLGAANSGRLAEALKIKNATPAAQTHAPHRESPETRFQKMALPLPWLWLAGVGVCLLVAVKQHVHWLRLVRRQAPLRDARLLALLERAQAELGVRRSIPLVCIPSEAAPAVFGFWRPRLLMPKGLPDKLSDLELRLVLLHELVHLKRGDVLMNWLLIGVQSLHWFNPFVWFAFKQLRADRELVCDAAVLRGLSADTFPAYGHVLLKVAAGVTRPSHSPHLVPILQRQRQPQLERRIRMIAHPQSRSRLASLAAGLLLTLLGGLTFTAAEKPEAAGEAAAQHKPPRNPTAASPEAAQKQRGLEVLIEQLDRHQRRVTEQQHRLDRLREELRIPTVEAETPGASLSPNAIGSLDRLRVEAFADWTELRSLYEQLREMPNAELKNALVTAITDAALANLLQQKMQSEQKLADLSYTFNADHPEMKRATDLIATVNRQIEERVAGIMAGLKAKVDAKQAKLDSLKAELEKAKIQDIRQAIDRREFFQAKRDLESLQRVREALAIRIIQEEVDAALPSSLPTRSPREP